MTGKRLVIPNLDDLLAQYAAGVSLQQIAQDSGYNRTVLTRRFRERGVEIRSYSDGQRLRWANVPNDQRRDAAARWLGRAWDAARGRRRDIDERSRGAAVRFARQRNVAAAEIPFRDLLLAAGFPIVQQRNAGPYNLDLAHNSLPVAVEINRLSVADFVKSGQRERLEYLLDGGWFVLYVMGTGHARTFDVGTIGEDVVAYLQLACRDPTVRGCYGVLWGHGQPPARARYDFGQRAPIPCPRSRDETPANQR